MQGFFANLMAEAAGHGRSLAIMIVVMLAAAIVAVAGAGFLTAGAWLWLQPIYGSRDATLYIGGVLVVAAVLLAIYASTIRKAPSVAAASKPRVSASSNTPTPAAVDGLLKALQANGRDHERLAVLTASEAIRNASPFQLIATGLVAGYVGGQVLKQVVGGKLQKPD